MCWITSPRAGPAIRSAAHPATARSAAIPVRVTVAPDTLTTTATRLLPKPPGYRNATYAQSYYPVFEDRYWNGYPGYHGEGELPPYSFFYQESFYWAGVRVLGGNSMDDTHFHYAPDVGTAVMNAAQALGYLPPPSPTPTRPTGTPTRTPTITLTPSITPTPICCDDLTAQASALCLWEHNVWVGGGVTNNCSQSILGNFQYCLEVAASPSGPWTPLTCGVGQNVYFEVGQNSYGGYYTDGFPHEYSWYRGHMIASSADGCWQAEATTTPAPICFEATPVATVTSSSYTSTPTATVTPTESLPDLYGNLFWVASCPSPVLRLTTYLSYVPYGSVPSTTMRLTNANGDHQDFAVPPITANNVGIGSYSYDCTLGNCIPSSWGYTLPLTLTVDYANNVYEQNESNNNYALNVPPPAPTPCGGSGTSTPSPSPTYPEPSPPPPTPGPPDLIGNVSWMASCDTSGILMRTVWNSPPNSFVAGPSTMRLENSAGDYRDFPVPALGYPNPTYYDRICSVGPCIPAAWQSSLPYTLTVDIFNEVGESNEANNISVLGPPMPTPCPAWQQPRPLSRPRRWPAYSPSTTCRPATPTMTSSCAWLAGASSAVITTATSGQATAPPAARYPRSCPNAAEFSDDPGAQMFADVPPGSTFYAWVNRLAIQRW